MNDEKLKKALEFLRDFFKEEDSVQTFDCRNIAGDEMTTIYKKDGITVDYAIKYEYIEIFGLTHDEYEQLLKMSDGFLW